MARRGGVNRALMAGIAAGFIDPILLQPLARQFGLNISDDIVRIAAGFILPQFLPRGQFGRLARDVLQAEAVIGAFNIGQSFAAGGGIGAAAGGGGMTVGTV